MTEQASAPPSIQVPESQYQKLGLQCISPGISTATLDTERLRTFNKSKHIAMQQKKQIIRMNLDSVANDEDSSQEQEQDQDQESEEHQEKLQDQENGQKQVVEVADETNGDAEPQPCVSISDDQSTKFSNESGDLSQTASTDTSINTSKTQSKSLRRSNIPKPLLLKVQGNNHHAGPGNNVRSAPPMVTRHSINATQASEHPIAHTAHHASMRVSKPRVIYNGRSVNRNYMAPVPMFHTSSPTIPRPLANMYTRNAVPMTAYPAPQQAQRSFERYVSDPVRGGANSVTRDVFKDETTRIAPLSVQPKSTKREFFDSIEIEDQSNNVIIEGDIRLMMENFQFQFDSIDPQMDKKMFLSICSKIWNDVVSRSE